MFDSTFVLNILGPPPPGHPPRMMNPNGPPNHMRPPNHMGPMPMQGPPQGPPRMQVRYNVKAIFLFILIKLILKRNSFVYSLNLIQGNMFTVIIQNIL